jgi:hypothetical protein
MLTADSHTRRLGQGLHVSALGMGCQVLGGGAKTPSRAGASRPRLWGCRASTDASRKK